MATVIEPFAAERRDAAVAVLVDAFVSIPLVVAAFGRDEWPHRRLPRDGDRGEASLEARLVLP